MFTDLFEKLGGRKFLFSILTLVVGTIVEVKTERGVSVNFVTLLLGISGVFITGNALITSKALSTGNGEGAPSAPSNDSVSKEDISEVKSQLEVATKLLTNVGTSVDNVQKLSASILRLNAGIKE
jgi:hypothetical protein